MDRVTTTEQPLGDSTASVAEEDNEASGHHPQQGVLRLALGAIGIVFGDIGTSPIYAFRETFVGHHLLTPDRPHIYGVLSLIFWSLMIVVTFKYVSIIMRADNKGEGGSLALLALINRQSPGRRWSAPIVLLGVFATALFYGDSMITPAMSVLSASEGLIVVSPAFEPWVVPIAVVILIGLFFLQAIGTNKVGAVFGPIMIVYFAVLAVLGIMHVARMPSIVFAALNPLYALEFFRLDGVRAFLALGSVVLAVTGAEALYADMGHFGRNPIRYSWLVFVLPALMLNYLGQGAMILGDPAHAAEVIRNPFFYLPPDSLRLPLVILSILATIIASQAVISGAFSLTQQAIQLGFVPRLRVLHTSESAVGQIYIPVVNWALMTMVLLLVLFFRSSSNLAAAYGIAVTGAMFIDSVLLGVVLTVLWKWNKAWALPLLGIFLIVDVAYLSSNLTKVPAGGWFPLLVGVVVFTFLTTWAKGRHLMIDRLREAAMPIGVFIKSAATSASRVPGTAVFMTSTSDGVPHALLHNLKHNKVLHERVILLTVAIADQPYWPEHKRAKLEELGHGFHRCVLKFGFMEEANVPLALKHVNACSGEFRMMDTSFFLSRQTLIASDHPGMMLWREKLFAWMLRNAESAMEFFRLPSNRVVELGSQVEI